MHIDDFKEALPGVIPDKVSFNRRLEWKQSRYGMDGSWIFQFREGILEEASYSVANHRHDAEADFLGMLESTKQVIAELSSSHGEPSDYREASTTDRIFCPNSRSYEP
jgi:hypothetical protein